MIVFFFLYSVFNDKFKRILKNRMLNLTLRVNARALPSPPSSFSSFPPPPLYFPSIFLFSPNKYRTIKAS